MIVPVVALPSLEAYGIAEGEPDTLTTRLGYLSEVVLYGSGEEGIEPKGYKAFLRECPGRVGPFDVLSGSTAERESKVILPCSTYRPCMRRQCFTCVKSAYVMTICQLLPAGTTIQRICVESMGKSSAVCGCS